MMNPFTPTKEQEKIIDESQSCVVIANPGSGKTTVISKKISKIIPEIEEYQGVVAISYTNKASAQLKKYLDPSLNKKKSFFGTIDRFYLSEIIIPFGKQIFGIPKGDFKKRENGLLLTTGPLRGIETRVWNTSGRNKTGIERTPDSCLPSRNRHSRVCPLKSRNS